MARPVVETFESPGAAAAEAAVSIANGLRDAVLEHGQATFIATGGRSPGPVYDVLARTDVPWEKVRVTLTDERWVDPHTPQSNERLVRERLCVERAAAASFVALKSDHATLTEAVAAAQARLEPILPADVTLLGVGEDGHIASLFPGRGNLDAEGLAVADEEAASLPRLSLTLPALLPRRLTVVLIAGEAKRRMLEAASGRPVHAYLERTQAPVRVLWSP